MARSKHPAREVYKSRIESLLKDLSETEFEKIQFSSHFAKYSAVLVSGYLEQAIKEILFDYCSEKSEPRVKQFVEKNWPISMNMKAENIGILLQKFDKNWALSFEDWLAKDHPRRQSDINDLVSWRNYISHGSEANTSGVTANQVANKFGTAKTLIAHLESTISS